jgi:gliding motility-associated-like protein
LYDFTWIPEEGLSCLDCVPPYVVPLADVNYQLTLTDVPKGCFTNVVDYIIKVHPETFVTLPTTFTPNGDGVNDIIYLEGWGIKEVLEYKIFNRWGELVFETDKKEVGWNGYYKGVLQNNDVYVFKVQVVTFKEETQSLEGHINLMR